MVEKRRSPAGGDSPVDAQRRKKLSTRPSISSPSSSSSSSALVFRERFAVLELDTERAASAPQTDARGGVWRVLWQPRSPTDAAHVGVFVELVAGDARAAELTVTLLNQSQETPPVVKTTSVHAFSRDSAEFGMSQFVLRRELLNPSNALLNAEGQAEIEVRLHFVDDVVESVETLPEALPQPLAAYDSKQETGMVGLKNQGATCYLNSLLQTLFHLRAFRQVVYETPTTQEDTNDSVSLALQRVFYRLQRQHKAVSTKELTRSFGWSQIDAFMQHDVQELYRILCDRLEEKMKHTRVDAAIPKLFEGKVRSFVQCVNVDFQSFRDESFYDLQLDVKGCKDLMQSFRKYVEVEMLDGDNQYEAEGHGKQDAKKGIKFLTFPPVLNIQLKRFEYEPLRDGMVKIHDRFEFPKTLVLDEFVSNNEEGEADGGKDNTSRYTYHLHSVLVHSGDVHGGHYYVFIRPGKHIATSTDWFRFDDDQISRADEQVAIEGNFGSAGTPVTPLGTEPESPLYSSGLFNSPEHGGAESNEPNGMDNLEFRSVDAGGVPDVESSHTVEEVYDYTHSNGNGSMPLSSGATNSLMLPLGRNFSSAYMLVYVRDGENDISAIQEEAGSAFTPATSSPSEDVSMADGDTSNNSNGSSAEAELDLPSWQRDPLPIPDELVTRFHEEEKAAARRKKAQQTEHLYMNLRIASDLSVAKLKRITKTMDFSGFNNSNTLRVRIKRAASIRQLCRRIYKETGVLMSRQRLWKVITRENRTTRPDLPVNPDGYGCCVESLIEEDASPKTPVKLFLQILNESPESSSQPAASPPTSPSSPSTHAHRIRRAGKVPTAMIHRHFWDEFTPPETEDVGKPSQEMDDEDEDAAASTEASDSTTTDHAPPIRKHEILLFIKFYDIKRKLGERLEYMGNIVVDSRITGAELAKYLHEALSIPFTTELRLYEEVQPMTVSAIGMERSLTAAEIQHGDIVCFQYAEDEEKSNGIVIGTDLAVDDDPDAIEATYIGPDGEEVKATISPDSDNESSGVYTNGSWGPHSHGSAGAAQISIEKLHQQRKRPVERYPDVACYFQYLLDRVEVTFHRFGFSDEESFVLPLLLSNVYDEVIDALAAHLGLDGPKRLFVRLYQHSPINGLPMKTPLRHSRYSGDDQTTLEELLTEYLERTNTLYYELLDNPITEIEAKKELFVNLSIYDACFATEQAASPSSVAQQHNIEVLVLPTHKVRDLLKMIRDGFGLSDDTPLRACEVVEQGTMIKRVLEEDASLSRYWGSNVSTDPNTPEILVEQIPAHELISDDLSATKDTTAVINTEEQDNSEVKQQSDEDVAMSDDEDHPTWFYKGVVHFNFQNSSQKWIHTHGVPCVVRFSERDTVGDVKERIRERMGISAEVFAQWNFALVKDLKASTLQAVYDDMEAEALDAFPMSRLTELCGADFEGLGNLGLEHADPTPPPRHHSNRRLETGIHIRQS
ncbi:Ubiquitin carboxyl-terminal hydrolase 12 [Phytophthora fragariae]|uniref:ubiquitinyl hydrolase 1 n=1 Tax=Phytophthora fragariae TaxID=53985 RepID=A0A6G0RY46_9STRA|nr:Ubiquitin carboxyl-terminal hydrolase 12 [Phytophthora fragariae]